MNSESECIFLNCLYCHRIIPDDSIFCNYCGNKIPLPNEKRHKHRRANGEGYIYKKNNSYYVAISKYINGIRYRKVKGGFKTKSAASAYAATVTNFNESPKKECFASLWQTYSTSAMLSLSQNKQSAYKRAYKRLKGIETKNISNITINDLQSIASDIPTYYPAREFKNLISHLYKMAVAEQLVSVNLAEFIVLPTLEEKEAEYFTVEEVLKLWSAFRSGDIFVGYILLMIYTGMMPAELQKLELSMIDLKKQQIIGAGKKTKKRKITPIVIPDAIIPVIEILSRHAKGEKVLSMTKDRFYDTFKPTLVKYGCRPLNAYACRHTTGTLSIGDITKKKELMRHSSISTTQRYTHVNPQEALTVANTIPSQTPPA